MSSRSSVIAWPGPPAERYAFIALSVAGPMADFSKKLNRPSSQIHMEYFTAKEGAAKDGGFALVLARSNTTITVPAGKTILDALIDNGIDVPCSYRDGICGTCETVVIEGIPDHRDLILSAEDREANKTMMICCSGSKTDTLVLDL